MTLPGFQLENGLTFWRLPRPGSGSLALGAFLPAGSRQDPPDRNGLAHLVEHLLALRLAPDEKLSLIRETQERGGELNAYTARTQTGYVLDLPADELEFGLQTLRLVLFEPLWKPAAFDHERRVIENETDGGPRRRFWDLWDWLADRGLAHLPRSQAIRDLWRDPGLAHPTSGYRDTRRKITLADAQAFHRTWYTPGRVQLFVVGDYDLAELEARARAVFGGLPADAPAAPPQAALQPFPAGRQHRTWIMPLPLDTTTAEHVYMPFSRLAPGDLPAASLAISLMRRALNERLRYELGWLYGVSVDLEVRPDRGWVSLDYSVERKDLARAVREVEAILDRFARGEIEAPEMTRHIERMRKGQAVDLQSNSILRDSLLLADLVTLGQPPLAPQSYWDDVRLEDVRRLASALLAPANRHWYVHRPHLLANIGLLCGLAAALTCASLALAGLLQICLALGRAALAGG